MSGETESARGIVPRFYLRDRGEKASGLRLIRKIRSVDIRGGEPGADQGHVSDGQPGKAVVHYVGCPEVVQVGDSLHLAGGDGYAVDRLVRLGKVVKVDERVS